MVACRLADQATLGELHGTTGPAPDHRQLQHVLVVAACLARTAPRQAGFRRDARSVASADDTPGSIAEFSPSGKLPVLLAEGVPIWDSLAIAEFVAELEPGIWPLDPIARAEARSVAAEMHSGFAELRRLMPMDVVSRFAMPGRLPRGLAADIARIKSIWQHCRSRSRCRRALPVRRLLDRRCDDGARRHAVRDARRAARRRRRGLCRQRDELAGHGHVVRCGVGRAGGEVRSGSAGGSPAFPRRSGTGRGAGGGRRIAKRREPWRRPGPSCLSKPPHRGHPRPRRSRPLPLRRPRWRQASRRTPTRWPR